MTRTVLCPECHRPARVVDTFTVQRSATPVEFLRVQCGDSLSFLVSAEEVSSEKHQPPSGPDDPVHGAA